MVEDVIISASLVPAAELLSHAVVSIFETIHAAKQVLIQKENFGKFCIYLEKIGLILKELMQQNLDCSESLKNAIEILDREVKASRRLAVDCSKRNKLYLLFHCRHILGSIKGSTEEIARALSLIPLASLEISLGIQERIKSIHDSMLEADYHTSLAEEELLSRIESGIQERRVDRGYANDLMTQILEVVSINREKSFLQKEFEEFKREIEDMKLRKNKAEELQMKQIIALLENADDVMSHADKERKYLDARNSIGGQPLEPLRSFYCPIRLDVMVDPVETSSGMTFEREAIQKWFALGNTNCPLTQIPIENTVLRPNKNLRQSIEEWKDRNAMNMIVLIKQKLRSNEDKDIIQCLEKLEELCLEKELHREWVALEDYNPVLVGILGSNNVDARRHALTVLNILAKDSNENKEKICTVENSLACIVRSLSRNTRESKLAVQLLLELSKCAAAREEMGDIRGCIFSLVTISKKGDSEVSEDAHLLLEILASRNQNVMQMANANYFKPLLHLLTSGSDDAKLAMAKTLSEIELTERQKLSLFELGALEPLMHLLSHNNLEMITVCMKCLQCLSSIPQNGQIMIREGAVVPLLALLYRQSLLSPTLREHVTATILHLAQSTIYEDGDPEQSDCIPLLGSDEDISMLFSLVSMIGPSIQGNILQAFYAMCRSPYGADIRTKLRQLSAVQLVQLCEASDLKVRANAVKLFCCLTEDRDDDSISNHVSKRCIESLLKIIRSSHDVDEIASAMGIISNLPRDPEITQWLLDAGALDYILQSIDKNQNDPTKKGIVENSLGALCRFTIPANPDFQDRVADFGRIIHILVRLLGSGTKLMKKSSAVSLKHLSEGSFHLSRPIKGGILQRFFCWVSPETVCLVHGGICSAESSFCLMEAQALGPLVSLLAHTDFGVSQAGLDALLTLINGEGLQGGSKALAASKAITPIIKLLSSPSLILQEKSLNALHRLFEVAEIRQEFGGLAHMALVEITQRDGSHMKSMAARVLAQLGVLQDQSSFF
ncbi:hypothetical protein SAY86_029559 [Trapa natans]|uniref:RING-type E3 ubiquitin transferase n=1 Tax=Trapa natans TaxID=22666 RepID=A0AAN7LWL7_TRANT|nr:hypothetical protein SAY86_029559 [Trapa natans]